MVKARMKILSSSTNCRLVKALSKHERGFEAVSEAAEMRKARRTVYDDSAWPQCVSHDA